MPAILTAPVADSVAPANLGIDATDPLLMPGTLTPGTSVIPGMVPNPGHNTSIAIPADSPSMADDDDDDDDSSDTDDDADSDDTPGVGDDLDDLDDDVDEFDDIDEDDFDDDFDDDFEAEL